MQVQRRFLPGSVAKVDKEHRNAAGRRARVMREDERRENDSRVHWLENVRKRGVFSFQWERKFCDHPKTDSQTVILASIL